MKITSAEDLNLYFQKWREQKTNFILNLDIADIQDIIDTYKECIGLTGGDNNIRKDIVAGLLMFDYKSLMKYFDPYFAKYKDICIHPYWLMNINHLICPICKEMIDIVPLKQVIMDIFVYNLDLCTIKEKDRRIIENLLANYLDISYKRESNANEYLKEASEVLMTTCAVGITII